MPVELNHTIVRCSDKQRSSAFFAEVLDRPAPTAFSHFLVVALDNGVSLDFMEQAGAVAPQHYAFLIGDDQFAGVLSKVKALGLTHWSDPARSRPGETYRHNGGRGFYFEAPDGHLLEVLTRPYSADDAFTPV